MSQELSVIVLAAGKGTRMKSELAKVLHPCLGRPLIAWVLDQADAAGARHQVVVVGHQREAVMEAVADRGVHFAIQAEQKGTGHAVQMCREAMEGREGQVLVLSGDVPLLTGNTLTALAKHHAEGGFAATVLTAIFEDPSGYGRLIRREDGRVDRIVEHKDASEEERAVREINSGIYLFHTGHLFRCIHRLSPDNAQGELYLTDVIRFLVEDGLPVSALPTRDAEEIQGVNTLEQLAHVEEELRRRREHGSIRSR
jgi:bifunctional UDP-N-acetylglucosamine pyrophosphorylase/glucosamine-1-phosphate N-acetyltransferase